MVVEMLGRKCDSPFWNNMELDKYQQAAVEAKEDRILVVACPGSGKTRTLVSRFEYMVDTLHIPSHEIVMLTFTRHAAKEMRGRLAGKVGMAFLGTFHAFALRIIEQHGKTRGWDPEYLTILDEEESRLDEDEVLQDMGIVDRKGRWSASASMKPYDWDKFRLGMTTGSKIDLPAEALKRCQAVWTALCDRLKAENVLTYGNLLLEALALLQDRKTGRILRGKYRHFLVDEAQDTDKIQWDFLLGFKPKTLFVVGDVDQSIYQWRSARPDLFLQYSERSTMYQLPNSYRFGINIGNPANKLIRKNSERIDMAINAIASNEGTLNVVPDAEYHEIATRIKNELRGTDPTNVAVLARTHNTLDNLADILNVSGVPNTRIGGKQSVTDTAEFRVIKGYLRLAVNASDRRAFMAVAPAEHITTAGVWEIRQKAITDGRPMALCYWGKPENIPCSLGEVERHLKAMNPDRDYSRAVNYLQQIVEHEAIVDTKELVRMLALESQQDQLRQVTDSVALMTCHAAKGLEWPVVFVVGMTEGQFPSKRSVREGRISEERNLLYVAMTRAEQKLYLVSGVREKPSQFLSEMGDVEVSKRQESEDNLKY